MTKYTPEDLPALKYLLICVKRLYLPSNQSNFNSDDYDYLNTNIKALGYSMSESTLKRIYNLLTSKNTSYYPTSKSIDALVGYYYEQEIQDRSGKNFHDFKNEHQNEINAFFGQRKVNTNLDDYYPELPETFKSSLYLGLVKASIDFSINRHHIEAPLFIHKDHLDLKTKWKDWTFSSLVLLRNPIRIEYLKLNNRSHFQLQINLDNEDFGIYNNLGKAFLAHYFRKEKSGSKRKQFTQRVENFIKQPSKERFLEERIPPVRWASAGALPIAKYKGEDWVVLSFRDIEPVGWTVPSGTSGNKHEHVAINSTIFRKFAEKICLFSSNPYNEENSFVIQKQFYKSDWVNQEPLKNNEFHSKQHSLRSEHDRIHINSTNSIKDRVKLRDVETPFSVKINQETIEDIIFTINPHEFGIEILRILKFNMDDKDYILDGEIHESGSFLLRRPVMLLSLNFLKERYKKEGSLGKLISSSNCIEGKQLDLIPKEHFHIFNTDIESKKKRLSQIKENSSLEKLFYKKWLESYEHLFSKVVDQDGTVKAGISDSLQSLSHLCPTSWKSIETAIEKGIL
ncbi:MAG: hypothetical protein ACPG4W_01540 [Flavobacteriales bacterium]